LREDDIVTEKGDKLRVLCFGAHPDDCEVKIGGTAALWAARGHLVRFTSVTNGETGHHQRFGAELAARRAAEARAAAEVLGVESRVLPTPSGALVPSVERRREIIVEIREFRPDLIITHRPNDYHPDHRYTSQLVQDAAYLVTVPGNTPEVPALRRNPVIAYCEDTFMKPLPFAADVVVNIDPTIEKKMDALHQHTSQMYEWIPWNGRIEDQVPEGEAERRAWLAEWRCPRFRKVADRFREKLLERYGDDVGGKVVHAEAFEGCEYGSPLDAEAIGRLFAGL
jgi:LmbE family N-acetylglucosaminyl deacetylase